MHDGRLRFDVGSSPEKTELTGDGGGDSQLSTVAEVPAVFRGGEVDDGVPLLLEIT
jgi:hypothetical protein